MTESRREAPDRNLALELVRVTEAGAMASWIAAGTAYAHHGVPTIPFYVYYSMFGMQRIGDMVWAAGDMLARGFLLGATSGRTTLGGEGLPYAPVLQVMRELFARYGRDRIIDWAGAGWPSLAPLLPAPVSCAPASSAS